MKHATVVFSALVFALGMTGSSAIAASHRITDISWSLGATIPNPHIEGAGAVARRRLFVISGGTVDCTDGQVGAPTTDVDIYDPVTNTFSTGPSVHIARDEQPIAATVGSNIYLIGGVTQCITGAAVPSVEQLNLDTNTWTVLPSASNLPSSLTGVLACGAAIGSKIYEFEAAGIGVFDTTTLSWSVLPASPLLTEIFCQATRVGKKIVITGPGNGSTGVLTFNPATGTLTLGSQTTAEFAEATAVNMFGQVVDAGGDYAPGFTTVQAILPQQVLTLSPLPVGTDDAVGGNIKGVYFIAGGNTDGTNLTPQVLIGTPIFGPSSSDSR